MLYYFGDLNLEGDPNLENYLYTSSYAGLILICGVLLHKYDALLGGSWLVTSRVLSRITIVTTHIKGLITPLITTHEPPSAQLRLGSLQYAGNLINLQTLNNQKHKPYALNPEPEDLPLVKATGAAHAFLLERIRVLLHDLASCRRKKALKSNKNLNPKPSTLNS